MSLRSHEGGHALTGSATGGVDPVTKETARAACQGPWRDTVYATGWDRYHTLLEGVPGKRSW